MLRLKGQPNQSMATWAAHLRQQHKHLQVALGKVRTLEASTSSSPPPPSRGTSSTGASPQRRSSNQTVEEPQGEHAAAPEPEDDAATIGPHDEELKEDQASPTGSWSKRYRRDRRDSGSDDSVKALGDLNLWDAHEGKLPEVLPSEVLGWLLLRRANLGT